MCLSISFEDASFGVSSAYAADDNGIIDVVDVAFRTARVNPRNKEITLKSVNS